MGQKPFQAVAGSSHSIADRLLVQRLCSVRSPFCPMRSCFLACRGWIAGSMHSATLPARDRKHRDRIDRSIEAAVLCLPPIDRSQSRPIHGGANSRGGRPKGATCAQVRTMIGSIERGVCAADPPMAEAAACSCGRPSAARVDRPSSLEAGGGLSFVQLSPPFQSTDRSMDRRPTRSPHIPLSL